MRHCVLGHNVCRSWLAAIIALLVISSVEAADVWHTSTIKYVYPLADGSFVLTFNEQSPSCSSPSVYKYHYVRTNENGMTDEGMKKIYAAALMAKAMERRVQVNFSDVSPSCYINRLRLID